MKIVFQGKTKKGKEVILRYPEMEDLEKMLIFINELSDERTFIRYQGEHETRETEKKFLEEKLEAITNKKAVLLLVFCDNKLVGSSGVHLFDKTEKHIGEFGIAISYGFRGEGIGKTLMETVLNEAEMEIPGIKIIRLTVYSKNKIAQKLYKKMGFKKYGMLPDGISRADGYEDDILMYRKV